MARKVMSGTRLYGRTESKRKENVAVYCDSEGYTRVDVWTILYRAGSIWMTTSAARVLYKALGEYLENECKRQPRCPK